MAQSTNSHDLAWKEVAREITAIMTTIIMADLQVKESLIRKMMRNEYSFPLLILRNRLTAVSWNLF